MYKSTLKINGTVDRIDGRIHPDSESVEMYCAKCKRNTLFVKKIGVKRPYIFWFPVPIKGKEVVYWECDSCNRFIYYEDTKKNSPQNNSGIPDNGDGILGEPKEEFCKPEKKR